MLVLAATDPAQPYGAAVAWPATTSPTGRPARAAGAFVILAGGVPAAYLANTDNADRLATAGFSPGYRGMVRRHDRH